MIGSGKVRPGFDLSLMIRKVRPLIPTQHKLIRRNAIPRQAPCGDVDFIGMDVCSVSEAEKLISSIRAGPPELAEGTSEESELP
jgi:hypothetical protein